MTALPTALQCWYPWLSWFSPELAATLGDMLTRMHPWLGRFQGSQQDGFAEPDGVEDLRRRGSYERLLPSEWLLATELPDEFLRRAASSEHLFLAPRTRTRRTSRTILAAFDAGPWQLGAPRLAHLALWILLARRAAEAGGELRWGVLQEPGRWHAADSADALKELLRARSFQAADASAWTAWSQASTAAVEAAGGIAESWFIGHSTDGARSVPEPPSHLLSVRTSLTGEALELALQARGVARTMQLPLPLPWPAAQLLHGRFDNEAQPDAHRRSAERLSLKLAPIIAPNGLQVAVPLLEGHSVLVVRVPTPGRRKRLKPKRLHWSSTADLLCAAFCGKTLAALLALPDTLQFWQMASFPAQPRPSPSQFEAPPGRATMLASAWGRGGPQTRLYVIDAARRLVVWVASNGNHAHHDKVRGPMLIDTDVLALIPASDDHVVYVTRGPGEGRGELTVRRAGASGRASGSVGLPFTQAFVPQVFLGGGEAWEARFGGCAVRMDEGRGPALWRVHQGASAPEVSLGAAGSPGQLSWDAWEARLPDGARAVGLVPLPSAEYALVVQAANRRDFTLLTKAGDAPMYSVPAPVERVTVCPRSGTVALLTRQRELHVVSTVDRAMRLVIHSAQGEVADAVA